MIWIVHSDKITWFSTAVNSTAVLCPYDHLLWSHTDDLLCPVALHTSQWSNTAVNKSYFCSFVFVSLYLSFETLWLHWTQMPTIGNTENNTRKWKCAQMQHVEQRFLQFLIQTKHFNIPHSLGLPLTVTEPFKSLLWEAGVVDVSKSITTIWCTTAAKVNTNGSQAQIKVSFHSLLVENQNICCSSDGWDSAEGITSTRACWELSAFTGFHCNVHIDFLHECTDRLFFFLKTGVFRFTTVKYSPKSRTSTSIGEIRYSSACFCLTSFRDFEVSPQFHDL